MFYVFNILSLGICKPSSVSQVHLVLGVNSAIYHVTLVKCSSLNMVYGPGTAFVYWLFKPMYGSFRTVRLLWLLLETSAIHFYLRLLLPLVQRGFPIVYRGSWQRRTLRFSSRWRTTLTMASERLYCSCQLHCIPTQQTHHVETTLCECGILVTLFSTWYQRGNHVIACLVYDLYNNMAK